MDDRKRVNALCAVRAAGATLLIVGRGTHRVRSALLANGTVSAGREPHRGVLSPAAALVPIVVHEHAGGDAGDDYQ